MIHILLWHWPLDWYCNRQWPGWGLLQTLQNKICNAYEDRLYKRES